MQAAVHTYSAATQAPAAPMRLAQLVAQISGVVNHAFQGRSFWVLADVANHSFYAAKRYHFFDLVEKQDGQQAPLVKMVAVAFGNGHESISIFESITGQAFTNNLHVLVQVMVRHHAVQGLQLVLQQIDTSYTIGQIQLQKDQVLQRLCTECAPFIQRRGHAYVTRNKALPMPALLKRIAVISAHGSAGYQDFKHTLDHNSLGYQFTITPFFTAVQGEAKAEKMQQQFVRIFEESPAFDVVVVIRGGGSQTDFLLFDTFIVGRVVAKFPIPVITGIGHQKNETIADLMAHTPLKTPTMVAEFIIAHNRKFQDEVMALQQSILVKVQQLQADAAQHLHRLQLRFQQNSHRLLIAHRRSLQQSREQLGLLAQRRTHMAHQQLSAQANLLTALPKEMVQKQKQWLALSRQKIASDSRCILQDQKAHLHHFGSVFSLVGPEQWLKRGFALVYQNDTLITAARQVDHTQPLRIQWADGELMVQLNPPKANG